LNFWFYVGDSRHKKSSGPCQVLKWGKYNLR